MKNKNIQNWARMIDESVDSIIDKSVENNSVNENLMSSIHSFIDGFVHEIGLNEDNDNKVQDIKNEMYEFMSKIKTKEDLQKFIKEYQSKIDNLDNNSNISITVKKYLYKIWKVLKYVLKMGSFVVANIQSLAILAAVVFVCYKFDVGPIEAVQKAWNAAKVIYKAANVTIDTAGKSIDTYKSIQDKGIDIGDKVGSALGRLLPNVF